MGIVMRTIIDHPAAAIEWIVAVGAFIVAVIAASKKVYGWIERYREKRNHMEEMMKKLEQHNDDIKELKEGLHEGLTKISEQIDDMKVCVDSRLDNMQKKIDEDHEFSIINDQAILRDRIVQLYNRTKRMDHPYLLESELTNYVEIYSRYDACKGNGQVHEIYDPYLRSLKVFMSPTEAEEYFIKEGD